MRRLRTIYSMAAALALFGLSEIRGQDPAMYPGYVLYSQMGGRTTRLIDKSTNKEVKTWTHTAGGGYGVYILPNGNLLRGQSSNSPGLMTSASHGLIQEIKPDGSVVWQFDYKSNKYIAHHDIEPMPNGNVLIIAEEKKTAAETAAMGFEDGGIFDHIVEIAPPSGALPSRIVWEWHAWDHVVKAEEGPAHPDMLSAGMESDGGQDDWMHCNGISYNPEKDQIVFSAHNLHELYIIDHSTTTAEAKGATGGKSGKGGRLLYRWGNPANYGAPGAKYFNVVHWASWIPKGLPGAGNLLAFNNGANVRISTIPELKLPTDASGKYILEAGKAWGPDRPTWTYSAGTEFYAWHLGSCQRLPNGNTVMCEATDNGKMREVTPDGKVVWSFGPNVEVPNMTHWSKDDPGIVKLLNLPSSIAPLSRNAHEAGLNAFRAANGRILFGNLQDAQIGIFSADGRKASRKLILSTASVR